MYFLELPLGISRSFGKHKVETGLTTSYLLGVNGTLKNITNPEEPQTVIQEASGWIEEDGFKKWHWDVYLEYGFKITPKIQVLIDLGYTPGSILDKPVIPGQKVLKESRPLFIDFGLRYKLF